MNKNLLRYRARTEWNGIELFDRLEGRVISPGQKFTPAFLELLKKGKKGESIKEKLRNLPGKPSDLELYDLESGKLNVERIIDTPYPKNPDFASAPRRVYWEFTRKCNLNCRACFNRFASDRVEMQITDIRRIARQLYDAGVYEIRCTGGEPTERPNFFEIAEELANMGFYISMGTNGIYSNDTLKKVIDSTIDWIILSIDGSDETTHAEIRGIGTFPVTLKTLEQLAAKGCRLRINTLIRKTHYTYRHIKGLAEIADRFNVESLNCIPLRPVTNDPSALGLQLKPVEFREFIQGLNRLRQEHKTDFVTTLDLRHTNEHDRIYFKDRSCAAGREGAVISPYGEIYGCSYSLASDPNAPKDKREKFVAGNLLEKNFLEVWNQTDMWAIYRDLEKYKHEKCKRCDYYRERRCIGNCPIMDKNNPVAFDPYCYLYLDDQLNTVK
jgi:radical SAM protein with 4Fe4S-binding SPASM domain